MVWARRPLSTLVVTARVFADAVDKTTRLALARVAEGQRGLFSTAQAIEIGVSYAQLHRALAGGLIRRVRHGVYAMLGSAPSRWEHIVAAALAAGPEAVVSHASAAAVHRFEYGAPGFECGGPAQIELTLPHDGYSRPPGVVVHRALDLASDDTVRKSGLLVTSSCRTLVDLAGRFGPALTERMLDEGLIQRRWTASEVSECLSRARENIPGRTYLERLLSLRAEGPAADSILEARAFRALKVLKPFDTHFCTSVGNSAYVIDAAWPEHKVAAEIVGRAHRVASRSAFDLERRKLNALAAEGWRVAHLTATMSDAEMVAAVQLLLASRSSSGFPLGKRTKSHGTPSLRTKSPSTAG